MLVYGRVERSPQHVLLLQLQGAGYGQTGNEILAVDSSSLSGGSFLWMVACVVRSLLPVKAEAVSLLPERNIAGPSHGTKCLRNASGQVQDSSRWWYPS